MACCGGGPSEKQKLDRADKKTKKAALASTVGLTKNDAGAFVATDEAAIARNKLFPPSLVTADNTPIDTALALNQKTHVGILFGGQWSAKCRGCVHPRAVKSFSCASV